MKVPTIKQLIEVMEEAHIPIGGIIQEDGFRIDIDIVMKAFAKAIRKYLKENDNAR